MKGLREKKKGTLEEFETEEYMVNFHLKKMILIASIEVRTGNTYVFIKHLHCTYFVPDIKHS